MNIQTKPYFILKPSLSAEIAFEIIGLQRKYQHFLQIFRYLNGKDVLNAEPAQWTDVWLEKHGGESEGYTYNPREELFKRVSLTVLLFTLKGSIIIIIPPAKQYTPHKHSLRGYTIFTLSIHLFVRPGRFCFSIIHVS